MTNGYIKKPLLFFCFVMITVSAIFYIFADFGKTTTVLYGVVLSLIIIITFICFIKDWKRAFYSCFVLILFMQIPPIFCWYKWNGSSFYLLNNRLTIGLEGLLYHITIFITMCIILKRLKDNEG